MNYPLEKFVNDLESGCDLRAEAAEQVLDSIVGSVDEALLAEMFRSWDRKGIDENEIYLLASVLRKRCTRVVSPHETFVDIVGTGGSKRKTFNVSTAAAFVAAGSGLPVAKHGNRAATSSSGSADVLEALGIEPSVSPETAADCLRRIGICFMFAPNFHSLSATLGKVRRALGFPTIFNCLGPLCNPANAPFQVIGANDRSLADKMAAALARLGTRRSWIVSGEDGRDEISTEGQTYVAEINGDKIEKFWITSSDFGFADSRYASDGPMEPGASATLIRAIFQGGQRGSPAEAMAAVNAAAAIYVSGREASLKDAGTAAMRSIRDGHALAKLEGLAAAIRKNDDPR